MTASLNQIFDRLGTLGAKVEALGDKIEESDHRAADTAKRADDHRAVIHRRVDDLVGDVGGMKTDLTTVKMDVKNAKEVTDKVRQWEQRGIGVLFVVGIAAAGLGGTVVGFIVYWWDAITRVLRAQ